MTPYKSLNKLPYALLGLTMIYFLGTHSPDLELNIDPSYIHFGPCRPLLYPVFIALFRPAGKYQFILLMWTQGIFSFGALLYARDWLKKNLKTPDFLIFIPFSLTFFTICLYSQIWHIQSEGLSFPLFIITFFTLIECFHAFNLRKIFYLSGFVSLLVLTRLQFYYFYILFVILIVWYVWQRLSIKKIMTSTVILFATMWTTTFIDHAYHYYEHGFFGSAPYSGLMILVQALYLTDDGAHHYPQDSSEKNDLSVMIHARNLAHLNQDADLIKNFRPSYYANAYEGYARNYLALQQIIDQTLHTSVENTFVKTNFRANDEALDIDKALILHNFKNNVLFLLWKFIVCVGNIPTFLFFLIILSGSCFNIIRNKLRNVSLSFIFIGLVPIIVFLNAGIIALCNPAIPVYFFYSQFMLYYLAIIMLNNVFIIPKADGF